MVRAAYLAYLTVVGSVLGLVLHGDPDTYRYIPESIRQYPGARGVARLTRSGRIRRRAGGAGAGRVDGDSRRAQAKRGLEVGCYRSSHGSSAVSRNASTSSSDSASGEASGLIGRSSLNVREPRVWLMRPIACGGSASASRANSM